MKFISGIVLGITLSMGIAAFAQVQQTESRAHPRVAGAIVALKDARDYLIGAPDIFGGHKGDAIVAIDTAIKQLDLALTYRSKIDHIPK